MLSSQSVGFENPLDEKSEVQKFFFVNRHLLRDRDKPRFLRLSLRIFLQFISSVGKRMRDGHSTSGLNSVNDFGWIQPSCLVSSVG